MTKDYFRGVFSEGDSGNIQVAVYDKESSNY